MALILLNQNIVPGLKMSPEISGDPCRIGRILRAINTVKEFFPVAAKLWFVTFCFASVFSYLSSLDFPL